jgi:hypothetical protein
MIKLCCTQQILKKLKLDPAVLKAQEPVETTAALGTWYAKYIINERQHAIVLVNDKTRMCLVTTAKDIQHLPERLEAALAETLIYMDVPRHAIEQEVVHYRDVCYTTTRAAPEGRSVVSTITQFIVPIENTGLTSMTPQEWNRYFVNWLTSSNGYQDIGELVRKQLLDAYGDAP